MGNHFQRRAARRRHFTLIELLAAMSVLVVLMFVLFRFFGSAEKAWSASEGNTRIYENARIAFEVITRDLQSAIASSRDGQKVPFYVWTAADGTTNGANGERLSFVSRVEPNTTAKSDICEVAYAWKTDFTGASLPYNYWLRRVRDGDDDNTNWDFFNKTGSETPKWYDTHGAFQKVIPGVTNLSFTCLDSAGAAMVGPVNSNKLPASVLVSLTLVDEKLVNAPDVVKDKTKRTFTKTIFLGGRE